MSVPLRQLIGPGSHHVIHVGSCSIAAGGSLFSQVKVQKLDQAEVGEEEGADGQDDSATEGEEGAPVPAPQNRGGEGKEEGLIVELPSGITYCLSASTSDAYVIEPPLPSVGKSQGGDGGQRGRKRARVPPILMGHERGWAINASLKLIGQSKPEQIVVRGFNTAVYNDLVPSLCGVDADAAEEGKASRGGSSSKAPTTAAVWDENLSRRGMLEGAKISVLARASRLRTS